MGYRHIQKKLRRSTQKFLTALGTYSMFCEILNATGVLQYVVRPGGARKSSKWKPRREAEFAGSGGRQNPSNFQLRNDQFGAFWGPRWPQADLGRFRAGQEDGRNGTSRKARRRTPRRWSKVRASSVTFVSIRDDDDATTESPRGRQDVFPIEALPTRGRRGRSKAERKVSTSRR